MSMIKVVAFDLDDTLWEVGPVIMRAEARLGEWLRNHVPNLQFNIESMRAIRRELVSADPTLAGRLTELRRRVIEESMRRSGVPLRESGQLSRDAMEVFLLARNQIDLFEGALDTIQELSSSFVLGVLTNGNADVRRLGLGDYFNFVFSAEQVGAPKPEPALFEAALTHTGSRPQEMVYVGDDPVLDVDAANRLGINTIRVQREGDSREGETPATAVVRHVREVPAIIRGLQPGPLHRSR